jgi:hypothetical protein
MGSRFRTNQRDHLLQWLILIVLMEAILLSVPVSAWIKLAVLGSAFLTGFILRVCKAYPGEAEPAAIDIMTAGIAFLLIPVFVFFIRPDWTFWTLAAVPFIVLVPHIIYIASNKEIAPPAVKKIIAIIFRKK